MITTGNQFAKQANGLQLVNGDDYSFEFEKPVSLEPGANTISLLSATIGLPVCATFIIILFYFSLDKFQCLNHL